MRKLLGLSTACVMVLTVLSGAAAPSSQAGTCGASSCTAPASAAVSPQDVLAGSVGSFTFTCDNVGDATLDVVRIGRPSTSLAVTAVTTAPATWSGSVDAPDAASYATFASPVGLAPGQSATFGVTARAARTSSDVPGHWSVLVGSVASNLPSGNNFQQAAGANNTSQSLLTTVRVLSTGHLVISPAAADRGTVSAGQTVQVSVPVTNLGTALVQLDPSASAVVGDTSGTVTGGALQPAPAIDPGATETITFTGVTFPQAATGVVVRVRVVDPNLPALQASARTVTVQSTAAFAPHSPDQPPIFSDLSCNPAPVNPGRNVSCSLSVDKTGDVSASLDGATSLVFSDDAGHSVNLPLAAPATFPAGSSTQTLEFGPALVPAMFAGGSYSPGVRWSGADSNGAPIASRGTVADQVTFDPAPQLTAASMAGPNGQGQPVIGLTFSKPVTGNQDVNNWAVTDSAGTLHPVSTVVGSGSAFWQLTMASSPPFAAGPATVTYCGDSSCGARLTPGNLHDLQNAPVPTTTLATS